jgi:integrase
LLAEDTTGCVTDLTQTNDGKKHKTALDGQPATETNIRPAGLPSAGPQSTVTLATPSFTGTKGNIVPKRRFQKGTFVKRKKHWVGMWRVDTLQADGTIKRDQRSKTFVGLSERAARAAFQPILDAVNSTNRATPPVPKTSMTVKKIVAEWREHIAGTLKPSSRKTAESHLRQHILPLLGEYALTEVTSKCAQVFVNTLSAGKRKRKTVENILLTLSSILGFARKWEYAVSKFSLSDLTLPQRDVQARVRCYSAEEMARIVSSADEPLSMICFILSVTGMRIGEVLALRVEDLDFRRKLINVRCSTYGGQLGTPKSAASVADLPMPPALETRLRTYLASNQYRKNDLGLLFVNRRGRPYSANKLREKNFRPLLRLLGIPLGGFHGFRHAVATEMIDSGAPITVVQAQLRHSDARITLGLYGHVIPESQRHAVAALADRISGTQLLTRAPIADSTP